MIIIVAVCTEATLASKGRIQPQNASGNAQKQTKPPPKSQPAVRGVFKNSRPSTAGRPPYRTPDFKVNHLHNHVSYYHGG